MRLQPLILSLAALLAAAALVPAQDQPTEYFSPDQLDNLLAPVALYPDPLVAQILPAATFPDQVDQAARFLRANPDPNAIDDQPWDVSVQALAHYPQVIYKMDGDLDWTTALGQAYVNQPDDVMDAIQRLRHQARAAGNLIDTPQQEIITDGRYIDIWPADPDEIYVPVYDPSLAFFGSGGIFGGSVVSFSPVYLMGVWLNLDCDWHQNTVYYHNWQSDKGWIARALPYIHIKPNYVNNRFVTVPVNRGIVNRTVNINNLTRLAGVHRDAFGAPHPAAIRNQPNVNPAPAIINLGPVSRPAVQTPVARQPIQAPPERMERPAVTLRAGITNFSRPNSVPRPQPVPVQQFRPAPSPAPRPSREKR